MSGDAAVGIGNGGQGTVTAHRIVGSQPIIRPCREDEVNAMSAIVNAAVEAYRGVIPADC